MQAVIDATLAKWGNSQGVRIPKDVCDLLGVGVGSPVKIDVDQAKSQVLLSFEQQERTYSRNRKITLEQLCFDWTGGKVGEEWSGCDVGSEVVE